MEAIHKKGKPFVTPKFTNSFTKKRINLTSGEPHEKKLIASLGIFSGGRIKG